MKFIDCFTRGLVIPCLVGFAAQGVSAENKYQWQRIVLNEKSNFEASGVADINKDGKLDIISGDAWYAAPDWKSNPILPIPDDGHYRVDFANTPLDVNGDGWTDIVSCNWHHQSVVWRQNPGKSGAWIEHEVDKPGNSETAIDVDVDGDGKIDFLPDVAQKTIWYRIENGKLVGYEVSPNIAGHGIGFGDVNGDGRRDILRPSGWFEAPKDRLKEPWTFHAEWNMGATGEEIIAHDFTGDGLADIWWSMGHDYGVFWLEQTKETEPAKKWIRHEVDKDWSMGHAARLVDLDGDGKMEIVTGKRKYAHDTDPGAEDPQVVFIYSFDGASKTFQRETVHKGDGDGVGLAPNVVDVNADGRLDLVLPGKTGLYLYLQK